LPHASLTPAGEERCAADFIALLGMLAEAFPRAPVIVVICDNDSIHHVRTVTAYLKEHPRLELVYGARYSPHDNPAERIWAALKNYVANTAVSWPGRLQQIHAFFRSRSPDKMLATAAPWTSPWLPPVTSRTLECCLVNGAYRGVSHGSPLQIAMPAPPAATDQVTVGRPSPRLHPARGTPPSGGLHGGAVHPTLSRRSGSHAQ
jgi:hypothetical protein